MPKPKISLRFQRVSDAPRLFAILNNPNFIYITATVKSLAEERAWLALNSQKRKDNIAWHYAILLDNYVVGAIGIKINQIRKYIGEIGYFIDEAYWGQGIASKAIKLIEKEAFSRLKLSRLEAVILPENIASEKVILKNNYHQEGLMKKSIIDKRGRRRDAWLYAKVK